MWQPQDYRYQLHRGDLMRSFLQKLRQERRIQDFLQNYQFSQRLDDAIVFLLRLVAVAFILVFLLGCLLLQRLECRMYLLRKRLEKSELTNISAATICLYRTLIGRVEKPKKFYSSL